MPSVRLAEKTTQNVSYLSPDFPLEEVNGQVFQP